MVDSALIVPPRASGTSLSGSLSIKMSGTLTTVNMPRRLDPRFPHQSDFIGRVLREAFGWLLAEVGEHIEQRHPGVTAAQTQVMVMIDSAGTRPAELARRAQVTRQSMAE